jgi:spore germination cell wall hydrolase CwlJ-like protein
MKIIITESQLKRLLKEANTPCPSNGEEDELITLTDIRNGSIIEKGYCNGSEESAIVKIQKMMKEKGYLDFDGVLGYYGDLTQQAVKDIWFPDEKEGTQIGVNTLNKLEGISKKTETTKSTPSSSSTKYDDLTETQKIIVITLIGEAGTEGYDGMKAVANVIKNRANKNFEGRGSTVKKQILSPKQFSMWNSYTVGSNSINDVESLYKVRKHTELNNAISIAKSIDSLTDNTGGALYYYAGAKPWWTKTSTHTWTETDTIGNHTFGYLKKK